MLLNTLVFFMMLALVYVIYVVQFIKWQNKKTRGDAFFSLALEERRALKRRLQRHAPFVLPAFRILSLLFPMKNPPAFFYKDVAGPAAIASSKSFQAAAEFTPGPDDIFIATQMKCGTTWMQQIVFEILHKGKGDLSDNGYRHMYALSPWIETSPRGSVPIEHAPYVSDYKKRLIKTHLPTLLCPYSQEAKYIYVTRHPVSCFASTVDFIEFLTGPMAPARKDMLNWFCSEKFYWLSWARNVDGWWQWSQQYPNVLFVHYEDLKSQPAEYIDKVARFLGIEINSEERQAILDKSSFGYMQAMEEHFEMAPPSVFSVNSNNRFMASGKNKRYKDVTDADRQKIVDYTVDVLKDSSYPINRFYPDVTA